MGNSPSANTVNVATRGRSWAFSQMLQTHLSLSMAKTQAVGWAVSISKGSSANSEFCDVNRHKTYIDLHYHCISTYLCLSVI